MKFLQFSHCCSFNKFLIYLIPHLSSKKFNLLNTIFNFHPFNFSSEFLFVKFYCSDSPHFNLLRNLYVVFFIYKFLDIFEFHFISCFLIFVEFLLIIQIWVRIHFVLLFYHSHHIKVIVSFPHFLASHVSFLCVVEKYTGMSQDERKKQEKKANEGKFRKFSHPSTLDFSSCMMCSTFPPHIMHACLEWMFTR